jgi:hypothetical protein
MKKDAQKPQTKKPEKKPDLLVAFVGHPSPDDNTIEVPSTKGVYFIHDLEDLADLAGWLVQNPKKKICDHVFYLGRPKGAPVEWDWLWGECLMDMDLSSLGPPNPGGLSSEQGADVGPQREAGAAELQDPEGPLVERGR